MNEKCDQHNYDQLDKELNHLVQVIARLRAKDGCPWDREQTHASLKSACVEEAAEVIGGINILESTGNAENLKEELGDLLLQVVMHAQIAEEEGLFALEDVIHGITEKMIRSTLMCLERQMFLVPNRYRRVGQRSRNRKKREKSGWKVICREPLMRRKN